MELEELEQSLNVDSTESGTCPSLNSGQRPLLARSIIQCDSSSEKAHEEFVETSNGKVLVARQGNPKKPIIISYHDLGLNYLSNFQAFFGSGAMQSVVELFCIYHITAPGQHSGADVLLDDFQYPSMDELSEQVEYVCHYYGISHFIGFGVGLGANVLVRFAHRRPTMVDGLIVINCNSQTAGWVEWMYHKVNIKSLRKHLVQGQNSSIAGYHPPLPESVVDYLIWYHLGRPDAEGRNIDAVSIASIYRQYFNSPSEISAKNLMMLMESYMNRTDLGLTREIAANGKSLLGSSKTLKMQVLNMTGDYSPHQESTVFFNGRLQPHICTWMKFQDAGMILEEQPAKVAEAIKLFLQGLGHTAVLLRKKSSSAPRSKSLCVSDVKQAEDVNQNDTASLTHETKGLRIAFSHEKIDPRSEDKLLPI